MYTVKESIAVIEREIEESKKRIEFLKQYDCGEMEFTEDNYHELCLTYLRGNRELGEKISEMFPFLKLSNHKSYINDYVFSLEIKGKEYKVLIPCSAIKHVAIIIPKPNNGQSDQAELQRIKKQIKKVESNLNEKTIFGRANCIMLGYKKPFRVLAYLKKYKTKKNYIKKLTSVKEKLENSKRIYEKRIEENKLAQQEYDENVKYFKENFVPQLLTWTKEIVIKEGEQSWFCNDEYIKR